MMHNAISADGTAIAYEQGGVGRPLVLVGGAFQTGGDPLMVALAGSLAGRFTVVRYDRRGRGSSGDSTTYQNGCEQDDLAAVIDAVGGRAAVFGMSSGAMLAIESAAHGVAIEALAVYEPPVIVDGSRGAVPDDDADRIRALVTEGNRDAAVTRFLTGAVGLPADLVAGMRLAPFWPSMTELAHTLPYDGSIMRPYQRGRALDAVHWRALTCPVLVVDGGASPPWIRAGADAVADALPDAARRTLEGQAHDVDPGLLAEVLAGFLTNSRG